MKKLFKNMSIVLVLALVIGLVPARNASAADFSLKVKNKYLYVGAKGEKAHGVDANGNLPANPIKRSYKVKVTGRADGDVLSFKSADRTIAKGSKKYERVFAVAPGETDVAVKINGAEIGSIHFIVKQNATAVALADLPEGNQFGIGTFEVKTALTPEKATDVVKLHIDDAYKDIAVVNEDGTITTKKPGEFEIYATTQQNEQGLNGVICTSEKVKCTAAVKVVSAAQKSEDEVKFVFDTDMTKIADAKDFKVYYKLNGADVVAATNAVTVSEKEPTNVVLSLWTKFNEGTEYFVDYSGQTSSFTSAKMTAEFAKEIRFNEKNIVKNILTPYDFDVLDVNGVEMPEEFKANVSFTGVSTDKVQISDAGIIFDAAGLTVNVTATFDTWYDDATGASKQNKFSNVALFTSVDAAPTTITASEWTIDDEFGDWCFDLATYKANQFVAVEDEKFDTNPFDSTLNFRFTLSDGSQYNYCNGNETNYANLKTGSNLAADIKVDKIESANNSIAVINENQVKAVAAGTTQILFYAEGIETPIFVAPLTVKAKAVPSTISAAPTKTKLNTNGGVAEFDDEITFIVSVKDQYGRDYMEATVSTTEASKSGNVTLLDASKNSVIDDVSVYVGYPYYGYLVDIARTDIERANFDPAKKLDGTIGIKFTAEGRNVKVSNSSKSISCKDVQAYDTDAIIAANCVSAATFELELSRTSVDEVFGDTLHADGETLIPHNAEKNDTLDMVSGVGFVEVNMAPYASNGYQIGIPKAVPYYDACDFESTTGAAYAFKLYKGATEIKNGADAKTSKNVSNGAISFLTWSKEAATADHISKLAVGEYTVKLYKVDYKNGKVTKATSKATETITVKDSQPSLVAKKVEDSVTGAGTIASAFEVKYNNADVSASADLAYDSADGKSNIFVKSATYTITVNGLKYNVVKSLGYTLVID